jgi:lipoprotein-releasing system permease protein
MVGALSLLVLEKQKDMAILSVMGADTATIKYIFIIEGMLWALIGGAIGMLLGAGLCFAQLQFGLVKLEGLAVENYPIALQMGDFVIVALTVVFVGVVAAWFPARKSAQNNHQTNGIIARLR